MSFVLSDFLLYHFSDFCYYKSLQYYGELKKMGKNKNNTIKIHENFKNSKPRIQFYYFYKKIV